MSEDWRACAHDGSRTSAIERAIPLPEGARLVPLAREAQGLDRVGRVRALGASRWAIGAVLPEGFVRTHHPSYVDDDVNLSPLAPLATAALCADDRGALHVAALPTGATNAAAVSPPGRERPIGAARNSAARQVARCARENECGAARAAQVGVGTLPLPVAASANERPPAPVAPQLRPDESPREPAAFRPAAAELADLTLAHLAAGGERVAFGRACEGEPLTSARLIEEAVARIRAARPEARIAIETNGSSATALRRLVETGVREVAIRVASARSDTYEAIHGPVGFRFPEVRTAVSAARAAGARVTLVILALPGLTDRGPELDALGALAAEADEVRLRDLAADARRALALVPKSDALLGMAAVLERLGVVAVPH